MTNKKLKNIIYTAVFASLAFVAIKFLGIPVGEGYCHLGDAIIYLAGVCLPFPYASLAGAIGGSLSDLLSPYAVYAVPTFIIKACIAFCFTNKKAKILCLRNFIAVTTASVITVTGYGITYTIFYGFAGLINLYGDLIQVVLSAVIFIAAGTILDRANLRDKIFK